MAWYNFVATFCVFIVFFEGSLNISSAQTTILRGVVLHGVVISQQPNPCAGLSLGQTCPDGATYAGTGYSSGGLNSALRYMVTPGGCTTETCTGAGGTDSVTKAWATGFYATHTTGATDLNNGKADTATLVALASTTPAALWCSGMNYGGFQDWYLPSSDELKYVLYSNNVALSGFSAGANYWSSSEVSTTLSWNVWFVDGGQNNNAKTSAFYVRCIRSY